MSTNDRALIEAALAAGKLQKIATGVSAFPLPVWDGKQLVSPDWKARLVAAQSAHYRGLQARRIKEAAARRADVAAHHAAGHCSAEIARIVGVTIDTVRADLRLLDLSPNRPPKAEVSPQVMARNARLAQIIALNWSWKQIAADVGLTVGTVQAIAQRLGLRKATSPRSTEVPAIARRAQIATLLQAGAGQAEVRKSVCPGLHSRQWRKDLAMLGVEPEQSPQVVSKRDRLSTESASAAGKRRAFISGLLAEGLTQSEVRAKFRKAFASASRYWQRDLAALSIAPETITHLPPDTPKRIAALNRRAAIRAALEAGETQSAVRARHGAISRQWRTDLAALGIACETPVDGRAGDYKRQPMAARSSARILRRAAVAARAAAGETDVALLAREFGVGETAIRADLAAAGVTLPRASITLDALAQRRARVADLYQQGWTQTAIADALGVSAGIVSHDVGRLGLGDRGDPILDARRAKVADLFRRGWSQAEIAQAIGASRSAVSHDVIVLGLSDPARRFEGRAPRVLTNPDLINSAIEMLAQGKSQASVAEAIGVSASTLMRVVSKAKEAAQCRAA